MILGAPEVYVQVKKNCDIVFVSEDLQDKINMFWNRADLDLSLFPSWRQVADLNIKIG